MVREYLGEDGVAQRSVIIAFSLCFLFAFSLLGSVFSSPPLSPSSDPRHTFTEVQPAAGVKVWYTEVVGSGTADAVGITADDRVIVQDGCSLIDRDG
ncbi:uncharacterized protein METZ01_LOCUS431021, partial [marine metagenome]